jgi:hypothetical protein
MAKIDKAPTSSDCDWMRAAVRNAGYLRSNPTATGQMLLKWVRRGWATLEGTNPVRIRLTSEGRSLCEILCPECGVVAPHHLGVCPVYLAAQEVASRCVECGQSWGGHAWDCKSGAAAEGVKV